MQAPPQPVVGTRGPKWGLWISLGCLLPLVIAGSCVAYLVTGYRSQASEVEAVAQRDVSDITGGWDEAVFQNRVVSQWNEHVPQETTDRIFNVCHERLGPLREAGKCQVTQEFVGTSGRTVTVRCLAQYEKARARIGIVYKFEDGEWKIRDFQVDSPAILATD